jgi:hypothetical protein
VPLALGLSAAMNWQYDGDLGWWIAAAYSFPILFLTEPFSGSVPIETLTGVFAAILLVITAVVGWRVKSEIARSNVR